MERNSRHIGLLQNVYSFCKKYNISHDFPNVCHILSNGLRQMAFENKMLSISEPDVNRHLVDVTICCLGKFIAKGPYTPEQLTDIANIGTEIKFESK